MAKKQLAIIRVVDGRELTDGDLPAEFDGTQTTWIGCRFLRDYGEVLPDPEDAGFCYSFEELDDAEHGRNLWVYAEEHGELGQLAHLVQKFLRVFRPSECWSVAYSSTCSKPRLDSFGGGAVFVTASKIKFDSSWDFIEREQAAFERQLAQVH